MKQTKLEVFKAQYFAARSRKTGIPVQFYELPPEALAQFEQEQQEATAQQRLAQQQRRARKHQQENEVHSLQRRSRRPVGDFSLLEEE